MAKCKICKDHLGNEYESITYMCEAYGKNVCTVRARMNRGMSLEEALTKPTKIESLVCVDPEGRVHKTFSAMCLYYNRIDSIIKGRIERGVELLIALIVDNRISLEFIGLDGKAYYKLRGVEEMLTTRQIIEKYRPDLVEAYDKQNPDGKYMPPNKD